MTKLFFILMILSVSAMASPKITCKGRSQAAGQGYEALLQSSNKATLFLNGKVEAELTFLYKKPGKGDKPSETVYSQHLASGYSLTFFSGSLAGLRTSYALVYHGGFAGQTKQAYLADCR